MPRGSLDALNNNYWKAQKERILSSRDRIRANGAVVTNGRVIPESDDLVIGLGRRLQAVVLFLDLCKFSHRRAETEVEQDLLLRVLNFFFTEMVHVVEDYGGVVEKNTGDGLMAYFVADPSWDCDVRQRAVAAALTMFSSAELLINPILALTPTDPVKFRVCMDYGWVSIARMGAARRFNNIVAVGTTANVASKMLDFAGENSILLGDAMLGGLPLAWQQRFVRLKTEETGWTYRESNSPYRFWEYHGRWKQPQS